MQTEAPSRHSGQGRPHTLSGGDACVEQKPGIDLAALRVFRSGEAFLERRRLLGRQAAVRLRSLADQRLRVEATRVGVEHHAVLDAVASIASVQEPVDDGLLVGFGKRLPRERLSLLILRRHRVELRRHPFITNT